MRRQGKRKARATRWDVVRRHVAGWLYSIDDHLERRVSRRSEVSGIELRTNTLDDWMHPLFFEKVRRALVLIGQYEPHRLVRIRRDIRIIAGILGGNSSYDHARRRIELSWPAVFPVAVADVALTIIHEATHSRISSVGIEYAEGLRSRIEAACVRQEAAFALRLPGGSVLAEQVRRKLERPWWTREGLHESAVEMARAHRMPEWVIRIMQWRHERRMRH